jgi:hypothetical protein
MCISIGESKMTSTHLYVGEAEKNGKTVHILAYQNTAESSGPNAMILPFPTQVKMTQDNIIDTSSFKNFLKNISDASKRIEYTKSARRGFTLGVAAAGMDSFAEVFSVGSYTVVLADHVAQIPEALKRVPENRRPAVSNSFLIGFGQLYPKQPVALCCWNGSIEAEPLLWWYEPKNPGTLFVPTMDAHDGNPPKLYKPVYTDHIISVGAVGPTKGNKVNYSNKIPDEVMDLLPTHVFGGKLPYQIPNGDVFVKTAALHDGDKFTSPNWFRGHGDNFTNDGILNGWTVRN